jgi:hypothetical protein
MTMAISIDFSGLTGLEAAVAQLQQQSLTAGGEVINATYGIQTKGAVGSTLGGGSGWFGSQSSTYTVAQLIQRVQAILFALESLPQ